MTDDEDLSERIELLHRKTDALRAAACKPKYSQAVLLRYREIDRTGAFEREIKERVPIEPNYDEATLSCGHKREISIYQPNATWHCRECASEWLRKAADEEQPK